MKNLTVILAASLIALPAFAQVKPAVRLQSAGKPRTAPQAPAAPGGKVGSAPVAGSKTTARPATGSAAVGIGSTSQAKASGASASQAGSICAANAAVAKLSAQEKSVMAAAQKAGVGGSSCAEKLKSVETAQTLAAINGAGLRQLRLEGCTSVETCSVEKNARVLDAKAATLAIRTGSSQAEALKNLNASDDNGCDFNGKLNDGKIRTAALTN